MENASARKAGGAEVVSARKKLGDLTNKPLDALVHSRKLASQVTTLQAQVASADMRFNLLNTKARRRRA